MVEYKDFASQKENTNYNHIYMKKKKNKCQLLHINSPRIYGVMIWIFQMIKEDE